MANRVQAMRPEIVVCVMKAISSDVRMAVGSSGVAGIRFEETPFPSRSDTNRKNYIAEVKRIVCELIDERILAG